MLEMRFCQLSEREGREIVPVARFPFKSISIGGASSIFVVRCTGTSSNIEYPPFGYLALRGNLTSTQHTVRAEPASGHSLYPDGKFCITISLRFELLGHQRRGVPQAILYGCF